MKPAGEGTTILVSDPLGVKLISGGFSSRRFAQINAD